MPPSLRELLFDTPLERPGRWVLRTLRRLRGDPEARYDHLAFKVMRRVLRPDSNTVDIGAHKGVYTDQLVRLAPNGRHWAVEPVPFLAAALRAKYQRRPNVAVLELALANAPGEAAFRINHDIPGWSGLRAAHAYGEPNPEQRHRIETIRVRTARLDDLLPPDCPVALIKADIEGAELLAFQGAARTLSRWRPVVIFEFGLSRAGHYGATPEVMQALLVDAGLRVYRLDDWLAGKEPLGAGEFRRAFAAGTDYVFLAAP